MHVSPLIYTHLSLPRYAQILGISPVHFSGAAAISLDPQVFPLSGCSDIWPRYSWQNVDQVSHEDLARAIHDAEQDIARILGYPVAPTWIGQEVHSWPRHHRRNGTQSLNRGIKTRWGKVNRGGRRAADLIGTVTVAGGTLTYQDLDSDGFFETARITISTTLTDSCEIKVYFPGENGAQAWEIRPAREKTISGGTATLFFDSWLFIDPELSGRYPTSDGLELIDVSTTANFITSADVYHEYTDNTQPSAVFLWEPPRYTSIGILNCPNCGGNGCETCSLTSQDGCLTVRDAEAGIVIPSIAEYDADDAVWTRVSPAVCREPDQVKLWYQAGEYSDDYLSEYTCDVLSDYMAQTIAWIATARLERPFCHCGNVTALADHWREDLAKSTSERSFTLGFDILSNPLGTHRGEVMAWQRLDKMETSVIGGYAI